jgi:hypothetical protein
LSDYAYKDAYEDGYEFALEELATEDDPDKPVRSVYVGTNAGLIKYVSRLWLKPSDIVLDMTYGRGKFWDKYRPSTFVAHDLYTRDGVDFRDLPESDSCIDVVAFDPPYVVEGGRETSTVPDMLNSYGTGVTCPRTVPGLWAMNDAGMAEAKRVLAPGGRLFVKTMDFVSSGKLVLGHQHVVDVAKSLGLEQVDEIVHHSGTGPQPKFNPDGTPRGQVHSRRAHSFLCIFRKERKRSVER